MTVAEFETAFAALAGNPPFPWQTALFERMCEAREDNIPASCNLPTGLGKTSVIHVWLLALASGAKVPRRLVYVVNRRTVVDQTTTEVEKLRDRLPTAPTVNEALWELCALKPKERDEKDRPLAISTLRGQFADNREWSADPARPAVICGTVDMIGSRLLFSGYGCGFRTRPLHAGFLGQDALIVHDEAHLEPAFQELLLAIEHEQNNDARTPEGKWTRGVKPRDFRPLRVMELTATSRAGGEVFPNKEERELNEANPVVQKRVNAKKSLELHELDDEKKLAETIAAKALEFKLKEGEANGPAVLVFVRKVDDVEKIVGALRKAKQNVQQLTGTLRGLERDRMTNPRDKDGCPIFARFLPKPKDDAPESEKWKATPQPGTVYLVCTSAGEVGVNISADHLVCDLSTFESMAQRFGRVNRSGNCDKTEIHVFHPKEFDEEKEPEVRRKRTLALLNQLDRSASPSALGGLDSTARVAAFSPQPTILPTSDILFDALALTSVRDKLPGRPQVEPYLHGVSTWEPPETHVAWRREVWELRVVEDDPKRLAKLAESVLEDYAVKPHELLRDRADRVFKHLAALAERNPDLPAWLLDDEGTVTVFALKELADKDEKERLNGRTVLLPERAGGLRNGLLDSSATETSGLDVADTGTRFRIWSDASDFDDRTENAREVRKQVFTSSEDEDAEPRVWYWFEIPERGEGEGSTSGKLPVTWQVHTEDVVRNATAIAEKLRSNLGELADALVVAAKCHDLGKRRKQFQTVLGNARWPGRVLAKSGKKGGRIAEKYRHEFGSLLDAVDDEAFCALKEEWKAFVLHVIATHHGRGRPHFPADEAFDPEPRGRDVPAVAREVPQRFGRLQRQYGRWGLAYLESLLRAADYAASAKPSEYEKEGAK